MGNVGMDERDVGGYAVAYRRDDIEFPVYVSGFAAAVFLGAGLFSSHTVWLVLGVGAAGAAYYNFPLLETGRPTLGANQYGIFVQGFGVIRWQAVKRIDLVPVPERAITGHELQIALDRPFNVALIADWRKLPWHRSLMRLPWSMGSADVLRVDVEPFDHEPDEIHRTLTRMWQHYRGSNLVNRENSH
jgi:hypothetical protein